MRIDHGRLVASAAIGLIAAGTALRASIHRLLGLGFIGVVILKLYLFDIWQLSRVFRIVAFLGLGAMLLLVSYVRYTLAFTHEAPVRAYLLHVPKSRSR